MKSITNQIINYSDCKMNCFQNSSTECYKYTSKAAVIKLSLWVRWHVMLLRCCRLQQLEVSILLLQNDRQRVAGVDWVTAWTYIFASHCG